VRCLGAERRLGPPPKPRLCGRRSDWIAVETSPGKDGLCGSMSLCDEHAQVLLGSPTMKDRVRLVLLQPEETAARRALTPSFGTPGRQPVPALKFSLFGDLHERQSPGT
jgi:hypothetical protein